jgi:hypothetical protein
MKSTIVLKVPISSPQSDSLFEGSPSSLALQRNLDTYLTSASIQGEKESNIFDRYKEIKKKNELLKNNTYNQFWKQNSTTQHKLLSDFESEKGRVQMEFLQEQFP